MALKTDVQAVGFNLTRAYLLQNPCNETMKGDVIACVKKFAVAPALLSLALTAFAVDEAVSPPVGGVTVTLAAAISGVPKITSFSMPMRLPVASAFTGKVFGTLTAASDSTSSGTLSDTTAGWSTSALVQTGAPYFIKIRSGNASGTIWQIAANTGTSLTVAANRGFTPVASGVAAGDRYEIIPGDTLATLLSGIAVSGGGTSASTADVVRIHDGVSWREFHYNTVAGAWREGSLPIDRGTFIIRPDSGVFYMRRGATPLSLVMLGNVSTSPERIAVGATGVSVVGSVYPANRVFGALALESSPSLVRNAGTLATADKVNHFDGVSWRYYSYVVANNRWQELFADRTNTTLPFGVPLVVARGTSATAAFWITLTPPYTL